MAELKNVLIIGAGGNLGPFILEAVSSDSYFTVSVLSRKGSSSTFPSNIKVHRVDDSYPEEELLTAFKGQDAIVLLLPPNEVEIQKRVVDAAIKAGVKRLVPGEFGGDTSNQKVIEQVPVFKGKQEVTQYLQSKEDTGLSWTAVINGAFFDWGLKTSFLGFDIGARKVTIYNDGNVPLPSTLLSTVGAAVASLLKHPSLTANKNIYLSDYKFTQNELLAELEKATGGDKWEVSHRTAEETRATGYEKLGKHDYSGIADLIIASVYGPDFVDYTADHELAHEQLELPKPDPIDVVLKKIVNGEKV